MTSNLQNHVNALAANPDDERAFEALEEGYFLRGRWEELVALYTARLARKDLTPQVRAPLLYRRGQILEERCLDVERAVADYTGALQLDSGYRPALRQLRRIHASRGAWEMVLQIAEIEVAAPSEAHEKAALLAEIGHVWMERLHDTAEAMSCFEQALALDPHQNDALRGIARTLQKLGQVERAAATWERVIGATRGVERAAALVALASLLDGPLQQHQRAVECYRRALSDDPRSEDAVEALIVVAGAQQQWSLLADLYERRFELTSGAKRRAAIALEAGHNQLEHLSNVEGARMWFGRALELSSDDLAVHYSFADLARNQGDDDGLLRALELLIETASDSAPVSALLEAANLHSERNDEPKALVYLEQAQRMSPDDPLVLEALSDTLSALNRHEDVAAVLECRAAIAEDDPESRASALMELGRVRSTQLGDPEAATEAYELAFSTMPALPGLASKLERIYRKLERWDALRTLLERSAAEGPEDERAGFQCSLGELLLDQMGDPTGAAAAFETALELGPSSRALRGVERIARASGDETALVSALAREADMTADPERLVELARELMRRLDSRDQSEEALIWTERLLAASPDDREGLGTAARLQELLGRSDELIRTLGRLEDQLRGPEQTSVRIRIARQHEQAGDEDAALSYWEAALESDPDDASCLSALRGYYRARGRAEDLAPILRKLADTVPADERARHLDELAVLLEENLCDLDGAIVVMWRLLETPGRPANIGERLEALLERAGRFEELAQQLQERRQGLADESPDAIEIDLRRAQLLLDPLGQFDAAVEAFRSVRERDPSRLAAAEGLERALRAANDAAGLAALLAELAEAEVQPDRRSARLLERAVLLEESLSDLDGARAGYTALAASNPEDEAGLEAGRRLETLLERSQDWPALCERLQAAIARATPEEALRLHERIADLQRDRMSDPHSAARHLEEAARIRPERAEPWRRLAVLYEELAQPDDLLRVIERELETGPDPERETLLRSLAARMWRERPDEEGRVCDHYERLLELDPARSDASEFLVARYQDEGRYGDVVRLLEARLESAELAAGGDREAGLRCALRIRIAAFRAEELDDLPGAIETLAPALDECGVAGAAAAPLADLYRLSGRDPELIALCERASAVASSPGEKALWLLRLADALRDSGADERAVSVYRQVLAERPRDRDAIDALGELYRQTGQNQPLAELLADQAERAPRTEEVALRMELARLLEDALARPDDALDQLKRVIELESDHLVAFEHALHLASRQERHEEALELIDARLERQLPAAERARLLESRADLLAGPIDALESAVTTYREAIALDPSLRTARRSLRETLERLGRWTAVLDCLYVDAGGADPAERVAIFERAVALATTHIGTDAAIPWLERLRIELPDDATVIARIADVHRLAGRFEAVLRALEDQLAVTRDDSSARDLHVARARILERDMDAPGRAIAALEAARSIAPRDEEILEELERLYVQTGAVRQRVGVLEARLEVCAPDRAPELHRVAAQLCVAELSDPDRAVPHLLRAIHLTGILGDAGEATRPDPEERAALLRDLAETLRAAGRVDASARAAEAELALLDDGSPDAGPSVRRRCTELHRSLAWTHLEDLANPDAAMRHARSLIDAPDDELGLGREERDRLERVLLDHLRASNGWMELADRLEAHLAGSDGSNADPTAAADLWLELARLREERLNELDAARHAYTEVLDRRPGSLVAIRGIRRLAACLGQWSEVTRSLELELELALGDRWSATERAALYRKLGDVHWRHRDATEPAIRAYRAALAAEPTDLVALRALQELASRRADWADALDTYEREVEVLGDREPERRREVWLRTAELARRRTNEPGRALRAYEAAAAIDPLDHANLREQAALYDAVGEPARFVETYAMWCDHPEANASCADHLAIVDPLILLGREDDAVARVAAAIEVDPENADAWDTAARLYLDRNEVREAADALERAGEIRGGSEGARRLTESALLVEPDDASLAYTRLRRATRHDAADAVAHAHLARVASERGEIEEAETSAAKSLDLAATGTPADLTDSLRLATTLIGAASARRRERLDAAARFYRAAVELDATDEKALDGLAEVLFERGDLRLARKALEDRLALGGSGIEQGKRLWMLGTVMELEGDPDGALERFREAIRADVGSAAAHAGIARLCVRSGRLDEAVGALEGWAEALRAAGDLESAAARHLYAAELELIHDRVDDAKTHLLRSIALAPENPRTWVLLVEVLWDLDRVDAVLRLVPDAVGHDRVALQRDALARLALLYARALERRGERDAACEAYALAVEHDPRSVEAALARARLLRGAGDWEGAARVLRSFCDDHPTSDHRDVAQAEYKLAGLLAGPLEDMNAAIRCYERALEISRDFVSAREPLATLLSHMPDRWAEAIKHHALLLDVNPTRSASIRAIHQIETRRGLREGGGTGLTLLGALGSASPSERAEVERVRPLRIAETISLDDPTWEIARTMVQLASEAIEQVLGAQRPKHDVVDTGTGPFARRMRIVLQELSAPGLEGLANDELAELLATIAALAAGDGPLSPEDGAANGIFASALDGALGRWTRRRIRKTLDGMTPEEIRAIDFGAWRTSLKALAAAVTVERSGGDLRAALLSLCDIDPPIGDSDDLSARVSGSPVASELLRRIEAGWCARLARS